MSLSYSAPINWREIEDVTIIKSGTIWLLEGFSKDKLVCKCDAQGASHTFSLSKTIMKSVDKSVANEKKLDAADLMALRHWAEFDISWEKHLTNTRVGAAAQAPPADDPAHSLLARLNLGSGFWTKMPFVEMDTLQSAYCARIVDGKKGPLAEFARALKSKGGLEAIGAIIAADCISNNTDRFEMTGNGALQTVGTESIRFNYILNFGNIIALGKGTSKTISGMDFTDPNNVFRAMDRSIEQMIHSEGQGWLGDYLRPNARSVVAKGVAGDLESIVKPHRNSRSPFKRLGYDAATRIETGMVDGTKKIEARLTQKYLNRPMPTAIASRLARLQGV